MILTLTTIFFIFGTIIGSFLNVVIYRYNTHKNFGGRSACMTCQNQLCWYELVPVVSFCMLSGRCRKCQTKISMQYPLVELASGIIFAGLFLKFKDIFFSYSTTAFTAIFVYYVTMFSLLLVIAVYDLKHKIIPDTLSFVFGILAFIGLFFFTTVDGVVSFFPHIPYTADVLSGLIVSLPFALLWLISKGSWMGLGDAKLAIGLGFLLGLGRVLSGVVVAFWAGALIGVLLIVFSKKHGMKSEIPFAPFLVLGSFLAFLFELHFLTMGM